jgi:hypothetical protein
MMTRWQRFLDGLRRAKRREQRRKPILRVEGLENRNLPSGFGFGNFFRPPVADVTYHGGPLLKNVEIQSVYLGQAWTSDATLKQEGTQIDGFLNYFVTSPYMTVLSQYNVGNGTFKGHDIVNQDAPAGTTIDDTQIRSIIDAQIGAGNVTAPDGNSFYVFFTAPGVTVTDQGQNSVANFAGYHDTFTDAAGKTVYYAVIPYPNATAMPAIDFPQITTTLSHEIAEGVTDPDTQTGWFDPQQGEIGDIAQGQSGILGGYTVQAVWSQADGRSVVPSDSSGTGGNTGGNTGGTTNPVVLSGSPVEATANQLFSGIVATINGLTVDPIAAGYSATIDWGDNSTPSDGTLSADPNGGFDVGGSHTYTQAGDFKVTITVDDGNGSLVGTAITHASVVAPTPTVDLEAHGTEISATSGQAFTGVVATFTDSRSGAQVADFKATIDWGDGTTSDGTVGVDPNGGFDVTGTHTFTLTDANPGGFPFDFGIGIHENGVFVVTTKITDTVANAAETAFSLAKVAPTPPSITAHGQDITATSGVAFTGTVATFTTTDANPTPAGFTATINWGDGTTSDGTIVADPNGGFDVTGTHTYTVALPVENSFFGSLPNWFNDGGFNQYFEVITHITDTTTHDVARARSMAVVTPALPSLSATADNIETTSGVAFTGTVAIFTDTNTTLTASDFTAKIDWGDGTTSDGTVAVDPKGGFDVTGTHTYTLHILPPVPWVGPNIEWGDGAHFRLTVTVTASTGDTASDQSFAEVKPAPPDITATGVRIDATFGEEFSGTVATFTTTNATATAATFTATIAWGDGTTSDGTVVVDPNGGFDVTGTHTYTMTDPSGDLGLGTRPDWVGEGGFDQYFVVTTKITDTTTSDVAQTRSLAVVAPAPPSLSVTADNIEATAGTAFTGAVATFTDTNTTLTTGDFTAKIDWGDGTTSDGTIAVDAKGGFDVTGTHTYAADLPPAPELGDPGPMPPIDIEGEHFRLNVTVHASTGDVASDQAFADVKPVPPDITATGTQVDAVLNKEFDGTVATFTTTNTNTTATASTFTATINWGDGTHSDGTVVVDSSGGFDVTGSHTYTDLRTGPGSDWHHPGELPTHPGIIGQESFVITVTITDTSNKATALAVSLASVTQAPAAITTTAQNLSLTAGQAFTGTVASFTDSDSDPAGNFTATIDWGDGSHSDGTITANTSGGFDIAGTHTYDNGGTYPIFIRIVDQDGTSDVGIGSATVADATMTPVMPVVGTALVDSSENLGNIVSQDYQQFLGRAPASAEVAYWVGVMHDGMTDEQVQAGFVGSAEFFQHSGNTPQGWVDAMYQDLLNRTPDTAGEQFWVQSIAAGTSRAAVALGFATSAEREGIIVQNDYQKYLGRSAAAPEVSYWVNSFTTGVTNEQIIAGFVDSAEYYKEQHSNAHDWLASVYHEVLNRKPDQAGLSAWLELMRSNNG